MKNQMVSAPFLCDNRCVYCPAVLLLNTADSELRKLCAAYTQFEVSSKKVRKILNSPVYPF